MKILQLVTAAALMTVICYAAHAEHGDINSFSGITEEETRLIDCAANLKRMRLDAEERSLEINSNYFGALIGQLAVFHNLPVDIDDIHPSNDTADLSSCPPSVSSTEQILSDALKGVSFEDQTHKLTECSVSIIVSEGLLNARQAATSELLGKIENVGFAVGRFYTVIFYLYRSNDIPAAEMAQTALKENILRARRMFEEGLQNHMTEVREGFESCEYYGIDVSFLLNQ